MSLLGNNRRGKIGLTASEIAAIKLDVEALAEQAANSSGVQYQTIVKPDSTNIFNPALITPSSYIGTGGQVASTSSGFAVIKLAWGSNSQLIAALNGVQAGSFFSLAQYNASQVFIAGSYRGTDTSPASVTKVTGASFVWISYRVTLVNQINWGDTVLPYEPYYVGSSRKKGVKDNTGDNVTFAPDTEDPDLNTRFPQRTEWNTSIKQLDDIWASSKIITVRKDMPLSATNFHSIMLASASITDASPSNRYIIQIYDNHLGTLKSDFTAVPSIGPYYCISHIKDYVCHFGMGETRQVFGEIPADSAKIDFEQYETCHWDGFGESFNIDYGANRIRYAIHYDQGNGPINRNVKMKARFGKFTHNGALDVPSGNRWASPDAVGSGTTSGTQMLWEDCVFDSPRWGFRCHSNTLSDQPNLLEHFRSYFISRTADGVAVNLDNLGFQQKRFEIMVGNNVGGSLAVPNTVGTATLINKILPCIKITGFGNTYFQWMNLQNIGSTLKITSLTTGNSSSVKLVSDQAGLLGDVTAYKGTLGLSGALWGDNELVDAGTDKRNIIGHRLGDCTTINKTLVLNIDGVNRTITFNKNYSNGAFTGAPLISHTVILADIVTALAGFATAEYFQTSLEYFPELSDVLFYKGNMSATNFIPKGSPVKFVGLNRCRVAAAGEYIDGIAIDNIPVSSEILPIGRIVKNTILLSTGRFAPLLEPGTIAAGDCFKVSANGKLEKDTSVKTSFAVALDDTRIRIM